MDGYGQPASHVERSAELEMAAQALTEHGNVSSHVQLEKAGRKYGVKPIFGLEAYTEVVHQSARKFHLTILAMNEVGYRNLMQICSLSWAEGFYRWPTVRAGMLKKYNEGLIVLSGCSDSLLACSLFGGKSIPVEQASYERAVKQAASFKSWLGDRFYLECQMFPELDRTCMINQTYEALSHELDIPLVGTADVHYPHPDDNEMQIILHAAGRGNNTAASQAESWEYEIRLTHPTSDGEVLDKLKGTGLSEQGAKSALATSAEIAERCNVVLPKAAPLSFGGTRRDLIWSNRANG